MAYGSCSSNVYSYTSTSRKRGGVMVSKLLIFQELASWGSGWGGSVNEWCMMSTDKFFRHFWINPYPLESWIKYQVGSAKGKNDLQSWKRGRGRESCGSSRNCLDIKFEATVVWSVSAVALASRHRPSSEMRKWFHVNNVLKFHLCTWNKRLSQAAYKMNI